MIHKPQGVWNYGISAQSWLCSQVLKKTFFFFFLKMPDFLESEKSILFSICFIGIKIIENYFYIDKVGYLHIILC